ncbi:FAD-dependent oxidoreductase [Salmonella enterica subsp. enterica serovar Java]|nr:hypothetical protein [Salmonella enterica subsp. enterica serovar Java]EAB2668602.1 FAD-dependent oxidoreductase [Salmonella enterica]ECJ3813953.1 FAD-dependent oxidoreductase [Salmonella enterica subsp. enterica]EAX4481385.1 FAD-dependent oxidoreductase [Salmonella enterica]EBG1953772.1 FAD-dependent oxidoreductase [Salmonella enterica]
MTTYTTTDVLICGAGVTGLTLAIELARHGVSFRLIEKRTTPFTGSRGKGIQPRTQEIFEDIGILNKVVAAGGLYPRLRTYLAALSVHVSPARQGIVIGTAQALIAIADFISPVLGGFVLGYALYGVWIGIAISVAIIGLVTAMIYLSKSSVLIVKPETE